MATIQLTQGMVSLIDDEDLPLVSQFNWRVSRAPNTAYARRLNLPESEAGA